jgi:glycerol-3-phosphate acyltransferase PlsX
VVADGFVGNILLKSTEGLIISLLEQVQEVTRELTSDPAATVQTYLESLRLQHHYSRYGASTLLGVQHPIFIGHGRSKANAVRNGMATAQRMIAANVIGSLKKVIEG